jgi:hypothetical protein
MLGCLTLHEGRRCYFIPRVTVPCQLTPPSSKTPLALLCNECTFPAPCRSIMVLQGTRTRRVSWIGSSLSATPMRSRGAQRRQNRGSPRFGHFLFLSLGVQSLLSVSGKIVRSLPPTWPRTVSGQLNISAIAEQRVWHRQWDDVTRLQCVSIWKQAYLLPPLRFISWTRCSCYSSWALFVLRARPSCLSNHWRLFINSYDDNGTHVARKCYPQGLGNQRRA